MLQGQWIEFVRASATANTFFIIENYSGNKPDIVKKICRGYEGFQTDGVIFLSGHEQNDYLWDFYNSDGSHASMCGNGTRAVAQYHFFFKGKRSASILTPKGIIHTQILNDGLISSEMPEILDNREVYFDFGSNKLACRLIQTGVPHLTIESDRDIELAQKLRSHPSLGKEGANVTFWRQRNDGTVWTQSYERGVEGFTKSCGTGAVAAAAATVSKNGGAVPAQIAVVTPGGQVQVSLNPQKRPIMIGPAQIEFKAAFLKDLL